MFTIGDFAALTGSSAKKLRHYDAIGLFRPAFVDPSSRYRFYTATQIPELQRIAALRDLGLPLRSIAEVAAVGRRALEDELDRRRREIVAQQETLARNLAALDIVLAGAEGMDVVLRTRPAARWASARRTLALGDDLGPLFRLAEEVVRDQMLRARRPPAAVNHGDGEVEVLIPITGTLVETDEVRSVTTPEALIATLLVQGDYPSLSNATETMQRWANAAGRRLAGPIWISYLRFSAEPELRVPPEFVTREPDFVSEVQAEVAL